MANEKVNKVILGSETLIDLTGDTVSENNLLSGATAHDASGEQIQGNVTVPDVLDDLSDVNASSPASGDVLFNDGTEWINKKITVEVTQAEYNALEAQGLVDLTVRYRIKDGILTCAPVDDNDVSEQKTWSSAKIGRYSTTEEVCGVWIDGKPIYRRVIEYTVPSGTGALDVFISIIISNFGQTISLSGITEISEGASRTIPFAYYADMKWSATLAYSPTRGIAISLGENYANRYRGKKVYIIFEYTKTID